MDADDEDKKHKSENQSDMTSKQITYKTFQDKKKDTGLFSYFFLKK